MLMRNNYSKKLIFFSENRFTSTHSPNIMRNKYLLLFTLFLFLALRSPAQRVERLTDSLTVGTQRTWIDSSGDAFSQEGDDCAFGLEMTFIETEKQVIAYRCEKGEWKKRTYRFEVITEGEEHFIKLFEKSWGWWWNEVKDFGLEIQMVSEERSTYYTVITLYQYSNKLTRKLISKS